jgi:hypothetical protein
VYIHAGGVLVEDPIPPDPLRFTYFVATEVAAPGPDVVGAQGTCQTVLNNYATCADVLAAFATCADLLTLIGSPADVITP